MPDPSSPAIAWRRLWPYLLRYRVRLIWGLACIVAANAIQLTSPWILKLAIDDLSVGVTRSKLVFYGLVLLALAAVGGVFRFGMRRIIIGISRHIEYDLRNDFFAHLQRFPPAFFNANRTGDLMSRATNDLNAVRMTVGPSVMYSASTVLTFIVAIVLMASIDLRLTLVALTPLPAVSLAVFYFGRAIHRRFERIQAQLSDISAVVQEALSGVRVVRAYGQEQAELERFRSSNEEYVARNRALIRLQGLFFPTLTFLLGIGALIVLWQGSRGVITGRITVGELVAFNAYLMMLAWPMIAFGWVTNMVQRGLASWQRLLEIFDESPAIADGPQKVDPASIEGHVELRGVTFAYNRTPVLEDVSVQIPAGRTVALVGATGSGKSTLLSLLPRLNDPPPGTVFIDGIDIREMPLATLRALIGFVPQEPFLFSDTLSENVMFAPEAASLSQGDRERAVQETAAVARLDKDVVDFPHGYATLVGERGITLSGGQKQRTALARALAMEPRILVLDDALSAVDTYTEEEILAKLRGVMRQRTALIVSHRISTIRDADEIVVLSQGRIVERGRHEELIAADGPYAELHRQQMLEEELAES